MRAQLLHADQTDLERPEGSTAIVAGKDADVIIQRPHDAAEVLHGAFADIDVKVAELQDGKAVERRRQPGRCHAVVTDHDMIGMATGAGSTVGDKTTRRLVGVHADRQSAATVSRGRRSGRIS